MDPNRKFWNEQQQALRQALTGKDNSKAVDLFMNQHAMLHSAAVSASGLYSFEDEVWPELSVDAFRFIPPKGEHSIAWCFWHLTRIEDVTMNILVARTPQLFHQAGWQERLNVSVCEVGNAMTPDEIAALSQALDINSLRAYRLAVGQRTRQIVSQLSGQDFKRKVDPAGLQRIIEEGAVSAGSLWLLDYWGSLTTAGLLLMPPTRHSLVHINEALQIKKAFLNTHKMI